MANHQFVPHFHNDAGVAELAIGVKEFMCVGASPPFDHPHVFLDMGKNDRVVCPYCATAFAFRADLHPAETDPPGQLLLASEAV